MSVEAIPAPWAFIIDTDSYSGNFERELCAWVTGQVGECDVGDKHAEIAQEELPDDLVNWFEHHVQQVSDDHGCRRPVTAWPTPGFFNDGMGTQWPDDADPEAVRATYLESVREYYDKEITRCQDRIDEGKDIEGWTQEQDRHKATIAKAETEGPGHYDSCQSVAIFLNLQPPKEMLELMKERAFSYRKDLHRLDKFGMGKFNILGLRLIKMELKETIEWEFNARQE